MGRRLWLTSLPGRRAGASHGALLFSQFKQAAEAAREPKDYTLFIDEFQNFGTQVIATILSETRKWKLQLCIAHQFVS